MTDEAKQDEIRLMDFLLERLDDAESRSVRAQLEGDAELRERAEAMRNTLAVLDRIEAPEAPEDLAAKTIRRVAETRWSEAGQFWKRIAARGAYRTTFSIREGIAIAAVILLLASVLIPSFRLAQRRAEWDQCASNLGRIGSAMQTYAINSQGRFPRVESGTTRWLARGGQAPASNSQALFKLLRGRYVISPGVFQCPGVSAESFEIAPQMDDFQTPEQIGYSYHHALGGRSLSMDHPQVGPVAERMAILADQTPLFSGGHFLSDRVEGAVSDNHGKRGQNVLYLNGVVQWADHSEVGVENDHIFLAGGLDHYEGDEQPTSPTDTFLLPAWSGR